MKGKPHHYFLQKRRCRRHGHSRMWRAQYLTRSIKPNWHGGSPIIPDGAYLKGGRTLHRQIVRGQRPLGRRQRVLLTRRAPRRQVPAASGAPEQSGTLVLLRGGNKNASLCEIDIRRGVQWGFRQLARGWCCLHYSWCWWMCAGVAADPAYPH